MMRCFVSAQSVLPRNLHSREKLKSEKKPRKTAGRGRVARAAPLAAKNSLALDRIAQQVSRMEAIGQLAGGIAHDFNNLLTVILGHSEFLLKRDEPAMSRRGRIEEIRKAAERGALLTNQLLAYSRNQMLEPTVLKINPVLEDMDDILRRVLGEDIVLDLRLDPDLGWVKVDRGQLQQIILNLAGNARDAMPKGGRLHIETRDISVVDGAAKPQSFVAPGNYVAMIVRDSGHGMDRETRARIFEPFFTTKELGKGTGLGLATVYGIVKQSGGYIWVESKLGHGSAFFTLLPRVAEPAHPGVLQEVFNFRSGGETILLVEDDSALRKMAVEVLRDTGYKVVVAQSGAEALQIAARHRGPLDVLLTDVVMPGMTGSELAGEIVALRPRIQILYMSGYTDDALGHHGLQGQTSRLLQKPFTHETLVRHVCDALDKTAGA
jgi:two-component system, cell cycle sensor histidine kinase and response regulator CckA